MLSALTLFLFYSQALNYRHYQCDINHNNFTYMRIELL